MIGVIVVRKSDPYVISYGNFAGLVGRHPRIGDRFVYEGSNARIVDVDDSQVTARFVYVPDECSFAGAP